MLHIFLPCWYLRQDFRVFRPYCLPPSGFELSCILGASLPGNAVTFRSIHLADEHLRHYDPDALKGEQ